MTQPLTAASTTRKYRAPFGVSVLTMSENMPFEKDDCEPNNDSGNTPIKEGSAQKDNSIGSSIWAAITWPIRKAKTLTWEALTAISSLILAIATLLLALGANKQIILMQEDERPWVGAHISTIPPPPNSKDLYFGAEISNTGKSPAFNARVSFKKWNDDPKTITFPIEQCEGERLPLPEHGTSSWRYSWHKNTIYRPSAYPNDRGYREYYY
jgi:hypothetical protein